MKTIKDHKWAIFFAFLIAIMISYPQIQFRFNESYQGIDMTLGDAEDFYQTRIQEVRDGNFSLASPFFRESKEEPYSLPPLADILSALLGKLFFLDLNNTVFLTRIFFSFLLFLAIYSFIHLFFNEKLTALAASTMVFFGNTLLSRYGLLKLLSGNGLRTDFLNFSRIPHPLISSFFFFTFLSLFWLFLERKKWYFGALSGLFLGLSFYIYFYTWTFLYVFSGILILFFFFRKDWQAIKRVIFVILLSLFVAVPYFINFYQTSIHQNYLEFQQRFGVVEGRAPILGVVAILIFTVSLLFFSRKYRNKYFFLLALAVTPLIVINQQVITGKILYPAHYHWYYNVPLAIIFLVVIFLNKLSGMKTVKLKKAAAVFIIILALGNGFMIQNASYAKNEKSFVEKQRYGPVLEWLDKNTQKEEVVLADPEFSRYIPIYTSLNVASHLAAFHYLPVTQERLLDNGFLTYKLDGIKSEEAKDVFFQDRAQISFGIYGLYYREREKIGGYDDIPDKVLLELVSMYQAFFAQPIEEYLKKYRVKYVLWDAEAHPRWALEQYQFLSKIYEKNEIKIYQNNINL